MQLFNYENTLMDTLHLIGTANLTGHFFIYEKFQNFTFCYVLI